MSEDLNAVQLCLNDANNRLPNILQRAVVDDDRRLLMMELQIAALDTASHSEYDLGRINELCAQLTACQADRIRYRLNRLYLESMHNFQDMVQVPSATQKDLEAWLLSELDSLYTEIADVTQIYVNQEHLTPLIEYTTKYSAQRQKRAHSILDNVWPNIIMLLPKLNITGRGRPCAHCRESRKSCYTVSQFRCSQYGNKCCMPTVCEPRQTTSTSNLGPRRCSVPFTPSRTNRKSDKAGGKFFGNRAVPASPQSSNGF
jgi:hypothetical protein